MNYWNPIAFVNKKCNPTLKLEFTGIKKYVRDFISKHSSWFYLGKEFAENFFLQTKLEKHACCVKSRPL